jgi:hypothetical protein
MNTKVLHGKVIALLNAARRNNVKMNDDLPYMPYEKTTLKEAVHHLRHQGYILVEGGRIENVMGTFILSVRGGRGADVITWQEVRHLLKANYPFVGDSAKLPTLESCLRPSNIVASSDTIPSPPPSPIPLDGVVYIVTALAGSNPDMIVPERWEPAFFNAQRLTGEERFIGVYMVRGMPVYVWFSDDLLDGESGFLAQPTIFGQEEDNLPFDLVSRTV